MKTFQQVKDELRDYDGEIIKIMEVCGTHTSSIFKNGIRSLISPKIQLISGPGCPVCVTSAAYIDTLVEISLRKNHCVLTFGDMMKVKGTKMSLTEACALGSGVRILYSPLDAVNIAMENHHTEFVFAAVGFETTTPIYALLIEEMLNYNIKNLKLLISLKTMIPAISYLCEIEEKIDAFLCPGHVSVIIGCQVYKDLSYKYKKPFVVAGFEGEHILAAIYEIIQQMKSKKYSMKNLYENAVSENGNKKALALIHQYFEVSNDAWRGIGIIENASLKLKKEYSKFDAGSDIQVMEEKSPNGCRCKDVVLGRINPNQCPLFSTICTPFNAIGPCMVSTEGVCGIWFKNRSGL